LQFIYSMHIFAYGLSFANWLNILVHNDIEHYLGQHRECFLKGCYINIRLDYITFMWTYCVRWNGFWLLLIQLLFCSVWFLVLSTNFIPVLCTKSISLNWLALWRNTFAQKSLEFYLLTMILLSLIGRSLLWILRFLALIGRSLEGLFRGTIPRDCRWVCHAIWYRIHLPGHDVSVPRLS